MRQQMAVWRTVCIRTGPARERSREFAGAGEDWLPGTLTASFRCTLRKMTGTARPQSFPSSCTAGLLAHNTQHLLGEDTEVRFGLPSLPS